MIKSIFDIARDVNEINESGLSKYATRNRDARRQNVEAKENFRPPFALDRDRIIYSAAFRRYTGKTQVVYFASMLDEQLSSRSIHTLSVAQIARTIGRLLCLNVDLIEAIALGHDLGHPPFGHDGETYLSDVSQRYNIGHFHHNIQSLRVVDVISKSGNGLNLTLQVREGLLSHDGEVHDRKIIPDPDCHEEKLLEYISARERGETVNIIPMTLESCVVRMTDTIAYIGQDIEDAIRLGLISREQLPVKATDVLGNENGEIIEILVKDVVEQSYGQNYISYSKKISDALLILKNFNYEYIYRSEKLKVNHQRIAHGFDFLFSHFMEDIKKKRTESPIYRDFLRGKSDAYLNTCSSALQVRDYIAGMTDRYFTYVLQALVVPEISLGDLDR